MSNNNENFTRDASCATSFCWTDGSGDSPELYYTPESNLERAHSKLCKRIAVENTSRSFDTNLRNYRLRGYSFKSKFSVVDLNKLKVRNINAIKMGKSKSLDAITTISHAELQRQNTNANNEQEINLNPYHSNKKHDASTYDSIGVSATGMLVEKGVEGRKQRVKVEASRRVAQLLMLNAWRRRQHQVCTMAQSSAKLESEILELRATIEKLENKLRNSRENLILSSDHHGSADTASAKKHIIKDQKEIQTLRKQMQEIQRELEEAKIDLLNACNDLVTLRSQTCALNAQLLKEREKVGSSQMEKYKLIEKLKNYEEAVLLKDFEANVLKMKIEEMNSKFEMQQIISNTREEKFEAEIKKIQILEQENTNLSKDIKISEQILNERIDELSGLYINFYKIRKISHVLRTRCHELENKLQEQKNSADSANRPWLSMILDIICAPVAIVVTIAQILLPLNRFTAICPKTDNLYPKTDADIKISPILPPLWKNTPSDQSLFLLSEEDTKTVSKTEIENNPEYEQKEENISSTED